MKGSKKKISGKELLIHSKGKLGRHNENVRSGTGIYLKDTKKGRKKLARKSAKKAINGYKNRGSHNEDLY